MKFDLTFLEFAFFALISLIVYFWTTYDRRIRRWLQDYFRRRRGSRQLKPKSPEDCSLCNRDICFLPHRAKPDIVPWSERKSRRGRPKTVPTNGHACLNPVCHNLAVADQEVHALVSNGRRGKQRILYLKCQACGGCRTSRYATPLYWLKTPLARFIMVMAIASNGCLV